MSVNYSLYRVLCTAMLLIASLNVQGQKLPNIQKVSVRAPADIKIDGKTTEWGDKFEAFNKATDVYYTLSNDDNYLYLTVQAKYEEIVDKIIKGGITLTINHGIKKQDDDAVSVSYPMLRYGDATGLLNKFTGKRRQMEDAKDKPVPVDDMNKMWAQNAKLMLVQGINVITEQFTSIYNQEGIKVMAQFDNQINYNYELAIPLKHLKLPNGPFSYHVKINEPVDFNPVAANGQLAPPITSEGELKTTDFWAVYTLAK